MFVLTVLAVLCGLRRGEIAALRWRNVDLAGATLAVVESAEKTAAGVRYKEPKGGRARQVQLSATVVEQLKAWRLAQAERNSCEFGVFCLSRELRRHPGGRAAPTAAVDNS